VVASKSNKTKRKYSKSKMSTSVGNIMTM